MKNIKSLINKAIEECNAERPYTAEDYLQRAKAALNALPALYVIVKRDGPEFWAAHWSDFENLQESPTGFGMTPEYAVRNLMTETGFREPAQGVFRCEGCGNDLLPDYSCLLCDYIETNKCRVPAIRSKQLPGLIPILREQLAKELKADVDSVEFITRLNWLAAFDCYEIKMYAKKLTKNCRAFRVTTAGNISDTCKCSLPYNHEGLHKTEKGTFFN